MASESGIPQRSGGVDPHLPYHAAEAGGVGRP